MAIRKKAQDEAEQIDQETGNQVPESPAAENPAPEQDGGQREPERDEFANLPSPCVYCGPTVRGVARQYTTYTSGIPEPLKEFIREHPAARALIVSTGKFAAVRMRLETPGTAEAIVYKKVKSEL